MVSVLRSLHYYRRQETPQIIAVQDQLGSTMGLQRRAASFLTAVVPPGGSDVPGVERGLHFMGKQQAGKNFQEEEIAFI